MFFPRKTGLTFKSSFSEQISQTPPSDITATSSSITVSCYAQLLQLKTFVYFVYFFAPSSPIKKERKGGMKEGKRKEKEKNALWAESFMFPQLLTQRQANINNKYNLEREGIDFAS